MDAFNAIVLNPALLKGLKQTRWT